MKNQTYISFLASLFILLTSCRPDSATNQSDLSRYEDGIYDYYFYESTGDNQFIKKGDKEIKIQFNPDKSDKNVLKDLNNLKWTVLYPNSKGQIKLYGLFSSETGDFILNKWELPTPFISLVVKDETELPLVTDTLVKNSLDQNDFEKLVDNPTKYNQ